VIRFQCNTCRHSYALPDALARVPLLCKGCGHRLVLPGPGEWTSDPQDEPVEDPAPDTHASSEHRASAEAEEDDGDVRTGLWPELEDDPRRRRAGKDPRAVAPDDPQGTVNLSNPPAAAASPISTIPATPTGRRGLGMAVDIAVGLGLAGIGALLGEVAVGKSSAVILREAGSAPKFPPMDLLLWIGCVATPILVYLLLANRGKTVGGWLRRRG
jgi:hypothetical protein